MARKSKVYYRRVRNLSEARILTNAENRAGFNTAFTNTRHILGNGRGLTVYMIAGKRKPKGFKTTYQEMTYI